MAGEGDGRGGGGAMKSAPYSTINDETARWVKLLHRKHPDLGHDGIWKLLVEEGLRVDKKELKRFMRSHRLSPDPARQTSGHVAGEVGTKYG